MNLAPLFFTDPIEDEEIKPAYVLEVGVDPDFWIMTKLYHYWITLGEELTNLSPALQKRWVRKRIEKEWGSPIKNPTQKRAWYEPYFKTTELKDGKWYIVVEKPPVHLP